MKSITHHSQGAAERARRALSHPQPDAGSAKGNSAAGRPQLRLVESEKAGGPKLPPWKSASATVEISAAGRAKLSELAERTERDFIEGDPEEAIGLLVAEGLEEGFLE